MAINYLNSININRNELQNAQLIRAQVENQPNDTAVNAGATPVTGQIYYNTTEGELRQYNGAAWVSISGDITGVGAGDGLTGTNLSGPVPTLNVGAGTGMTINADDIAVTPAQTGITSIYNTSLVVGGASGVNDIQFGASKIAFTANSVSVGNIYSGGFRPSADNTFALGTSTYKWSSVYATTFLGDLNGTINTATTGVTQSVGDNSTLIATTAYADAAAAAVPIGDYLPLSAGSSYPLTGDLYITKLTPKLFITDTAASNCILEISQQGSTTSFTSRGGTSSTGQFNFRITNGSTTTNALFINQQARATFAGDVVINGGDITLGGTGRIQGVDTVTDGTDATNKTYVDNAIAGAAYTFDIGADTGTDQGVASGDIVDIAGSANIGTAVSIVNSKPTVTVSLGDSISIGGDFDADGEGTFGGAVSIDGDLNMNSNQINDLLDPTTAQDAATKNYVDNAVVGGLVYQGGYNAATNTPDLDVSPSASIKKGWTYTVTAEGLFFTEQVRVGDVIIAESDAPTTLAEWTTVQNNIDLADLTTVGIGNVNQGGGINVSYSNGTATVSGEDSSATNKGIVIVSAGAGISVGYSSGTATVTNTDTNSGNTATGTITAGNLTGTVTHAFGINTIVQTIDSSGNTVYCDISRTATTSVATIATAEATDITILVQKIG